MKLLRYITALLLIALFWPAHSAADDSLSLSRNLWKFTGLVSWDTDSWSTVPERFVFSGPEGPTQDERLRHSFYLTINKIYQGNLVEAERLFTELSALARVEGYHNLPDFSFELLNQAKEELSRGENEDAGESLIDRFSIALAYNCQP